VKYLSKYGNTADSTENTVESYVFQSRNFHIKTTRTTLHPMAYEILYARKVDLWDKLKEVKKFQLFPCVHDLGKIYGSF
jgi:hypothetical protein